MANIKTFLGANTPKGFTWMQNEIYNPYKNEKIYIIKGGAGTGKSTFMKKIADRGEKLGFSVERIYCSSDPKSLDGVRINELDFCIIDGTSPHVADPMFPGAAENIINLSEFWDKNKLFEKREEIKALSLENSLYHRKASLYLSSAGGVYEDMRKTVSTHIKEEKIYSFATRFVLRELPKKKDGKTGKKQRRYISGITPEGIVFFGETFKALSLRVIGIKDDYSAVSPLIIDLIAEGATRRGYDVILCPCVMKGELTEHIIIPEMNLSVVTVKKRHNMKLTPVRLIHTERFLYTDELSGYKNKLSCSGKILDELLKESVFYLKKAKATHDMLEKCYIEAMDYERLDEFALLEHFLEELFGIDGILVIEVYEKRILDFKNTVDLLSQCLFIEKFGNLETDLCVFIGEERSDTGLCRSESLATQSLFLKLVEINMVRHYYLNSV